MDKLNLLLLNCVATFALLAVPAIKPDTAHADGGSADTLFLTDEPGNWFKSQRTGTPFTAINPHRKILREISLTNDYASTQQFGINNVKKGLSSSP
jgi:hypothetical protein